MHQRQDLLEHLRQVKQLVDRAAPWADSMKSAQKAYVAAVPEPLGLSSSGSSWPVLS